MNNFKTGANGLALLKHFEGCKLEAYHDSRGIVTIGYGHTGFLNGEPLKIGDTITQQQAEDLLKSDLFVREKGINQLIEVIIDQDKFDAVIDFVYNEGINAFRGSNLLNLINKGLFPQASQEFQKWVRAGDQILPGLVKRRAAESILFLDGKLII